MTYAERFSHYFDQEVAQKAAKSLSNGAEMEIHVLNATGDSPSDSQAEVFTFTKVDGKNSIQARPARDPQLVFTLTSAAADAILSDTSQDIGAIGVNIAKLVASKDPIRKVSVKFKAGFLSLFSKGYFGIMTTGGSQFASFLASQGVSGMGAIKDVLKKMKS